ncbi:MAG: hypothetical protein H8E34_14155 [Bacteroidetes bacterium]|nr:hypothetical protein [Bacteroidota bacterium]
MELINKAIKTLATLLILILYNTAPAQELLGVILGNYRGTSGLMINPAGMTTNKVYLDINLATANVFIRNNFAYLPKEDFIIWDALKKGYEFPTYGPYNKNVIYYQNQNHKNAAISAKVLGPSAMLQVGDHAFGITTGVRYLLTGTRIPWDIAELSYNGLDYDPLHNIEFNGNNFNMNTSVWMEVGLSYAYNVHKSFDQQLTVGITIKKLWGYGGGYLDATNANYLVENDSTIDIINLNAHAGFSLPVDYNNNDFTGETASFTGSGFSMDVGAVFIKKKNVNLNEWRGKKLCAQTYEEYIYRIGVSILDIGRVKYDENAQLHDYNDVSKYWPSVDTLGFSNINEMMAGFSNEFYGNPSTSLVSNTIKVGLPTALSVQADFYLKDNVYIGGFWIHPLRINMSSLRRPAQLAVVPRFETKYFELSLPISLYEYKYPRIGIAARIYFVTVGTERLGTYLGMTDMDGLDIYASVKLGINKGSCRSKLSDACSNTNFGNKYSKRRNR